MNPAADLSIRVDIESEIKERATIHLNAGCVEPMENIAGGWFVAYR